MPKDIHRISTTDLAELERHEQVTVPAAELAGATREGLPGLAVGTRLQVLRSCWPLTSLGWSAKGLPQPV